MCQSKKHSLQSLSLLVLVLFLFSVSSLSAEVVLTDQEYQIVMDSLTESQLENRLLERELIEVKAELKVVSSDLTELSIEHGVLTINSQLQSESYEQQKKRIKLIWVDRIVSGILGGLAGAGINELVK